MVSVGVLEFESPWNWKVMVDNFMESYHHLGPHRESLQKTNPAKQTYCMDLEGPFALLDNPGVAGNAGLYVGQVFPTLLFALLGRLVTRDIPVRALSGPIEIAQISRQMIVSLQSFLGLLAFISLQLGILNLLPIPVLDGGHILILGVEGAMRRELPDRIKERVMLAGLVFLLALFSVVIFFDVDKLLSL